MQRNGLEWLYRLTREPGRRDERAQPDERRVLDPHEPVPDDRMGEIGKAFIVPRPGASPDAEGLAAWARANMANYKVPRIFEIVESLPLNASGKVLKTELRKTA